MNTKGKLSTRQELVFRLLTDKGLSPRQVGEALHISTQRVYQQIEAIKGKGWDIGNGKEGSNGARAAN